MPTQFGNNYSNSKEMVAFISKSIMAAGAILNFSYDAFSTSHNIKAKWQY